MSRATNRTSNISVTWNFKNPNISRNELINYIHLFREVPGYSREVPGYSRVLSRHSESFPTTPPEISRFLLPLDISTASLSSSGAISPFSSFISHLSSDVLPKVSREAFLSESASSRKFSESFPKGFSLRFSVLPKVSRLLHLKSRDSCYLSISLLPRGLRQAPYRHFHQSPARKSPERLFSSLLVSILSKVSRKSFLSESASSRKSPERLFSPIQRPPESFLTSPPEISRFPFGTKVIKILDLSPYLPPTRPFTLSPTLPYSPKPVFPIPQNQSFTNHATRPNPLLSFINLLARSILISPRLTTTLISPVHYQPRHQTESTSLVYQSPSTFYPHLTLSYNNTHQSSSSLPTITKFAFPTVPCTVLLQSGNLELVAQGIARNLKRSALM